MSIKRSLLTIAISTSLITTQAQVTWPAITQQAKPWARWWWEGSAVNKKDLTLNMQEYKAAGLGGLEITPIYGVMGYEKQFLSFLSPQWMAMLDHTLAEGKRLGLGIDLANGTGWPFGGPAITKKEASKTVVYKTWALASGEELRDNITYVQEPFVRTANNKTAKVEDILPVIAQNKNLQELALDQVKFGGELPLKLLMAYSDKGEAINITANVGAGGKLNWKAPQGNWTLYGLFEALHGKMVERAAPGGEGYAIDHFSADALKHYFKNFDEAFKGHDISGIRALFNDSYEVDDARGQSNWTANLLSEFQRRRGYDLSKFLPALFQKSDADLNSRVLFDYRTTIGELILEDFTQEWKKWGTTKGAIIRNQSHGSPANLLDLYGAIDIPETEGIDIMRYKFATSAAHVLGKPLASCEAATWLNEHFLSSWGDVKKILDLFMLGGVNHIFYHGVNYSPKQEQWPGWLFYAAVHFQQTNPQWKDFHKLNAYVARNQSFLQAGQPDNDILVYYPLADRYAVPENELLQHFDGMGREFEGTDFKSVSEWMQANGYSFDFFSDKQLQHFSGGKQVLTGGNAYQTILLPANEYIPAASFQKLVALARNGATILVYKKLPKDVPGYAHLKENRAAFQNNLAALKFTGSGNVQSATIGKGFFMVSNDMQAMLSAAKVRRETLHDLGLQFIRRKNKDGQTYFIANRSDKAVESWVSLQGKARSVALFDAMTANSGIARFRAGEDGTTEVLLQLQPYESVIVKLFTSVKSGNKYPYATVTGEAQPIEGDWKLTFIEGGPSLPANIVIPNLGSWTDLKGDAYKYFSGTARYAIAFAKPAGSATGWKLNLGKVHETAEVILNGKKLGTLIGPDFLLVIPATALKATNQLEITIANLMANRIIYMDKNNISWKKFYNTNMPARRRENAKNGIFDASGWQPLPSGLLGPVTITPVSFQAH
ncbi:glycoside hydrolase family 2 protein [Segetibacter sp. 3557_3]|uniref:glycosyl hydrolase n=1 Tax=Segetibacter sp. 3557_3 TaxID=2547429 RepID=UPI001059164C|nr:glycosyl hydrolase [Segetibacter sp. 3557_3]TDH26473.1 glycoside hydrolase family 2 protein [Segetibacter sp. 3557_3]